MALNHPGPIDTVELVENVRPWAHTPNAVELPDGSVFLVWSAGQFEISEDVIIPGALLGKDRKWRKSHVVVSRFDMNGETWIPCSPTVISTDDGQLHIFFAGNPLSAWIFDPHPHSSVRSAWMLGDDKKSKMFHARLRDFKCAELRMVLPDEPGVNMARKALHLKSGDWVVPFDSMTTIHSHFAILDDNLEVREKRGDVFCPPGSCEPALVQLPDGDIICYLRFDPFDPGWSAWDWGKAITGAAPQGHVWKTVSHDECRSFAKPISTNLRNPNASIDIALSQSGRFLIAYNDSYTLRLPLCVGISDDMGKTFLVRDIETGLREPCYAWPFANYLHNCHAYPKLLQTRDGIWHVFYAHRYECIKHAWFDETWLEKGRKVVGLA